mmetsp:Transcript_1075/g.2101  ORF Transcript_1075/g.2101 Transcript_1075/m.2101 type:complete len:204 (+) Transcript_1075:314-925(+)
MEYSENTETTWRIIFSTHVVLQTGPVAATAPRGLALDQPSPQIRTLLLQRDPLVVHILQHRARPLQQIRPIGRSRQRRAGRHQRPRRLTPLRPRAIPRQRSDATEQRRQLVKLTVHVLAPTFLPVPFAFHPRGGAFFAGSLLLLLFGEDGVHAVTGGGGGGRSGGNRGGGRRGGGGGGGRGERSGGGGGQIQRHGDPQTLHSL